MRRVRDRDGSPKSMRSQTRRRTHHDRSGPGSPRRSHRDRVYAATGHHSTLRIGNLKTSHSEAFQTLCVRNFSSKLSIEAIQEYLFQDFNGFGDMSISVGHLDGERAALINFKYPEDAQAAYSAKPTVYLHDRTVTVEPLLDTITEDSAPSSVYSTGKPASDAEEELDPIFDRRGSRHGLSHKLDPRFTAEIPSKSIGLPGAVATPSLLGMPTLASSAMVAAAAARALGFGSTNPLATGIPAAIQAPIKSHNFLKSTGHRWYDPQYRGRSPPGADGDQDFKATRTLFIGSLEPDITESEVVESFERFGYIEQIDIKRSTKIGMHSYAFVRFQNVDMAYRAKSIMSGRCIRSLHCKIGYGKCIPSTCLYIGGLGKDMFVETVNRLLPRLPHVVQVDMVPGRSFAQILFETCEAACEASKQLKTLAMGLRVAKRLRIDFIDPETFRNPVQKSQMGLLAPGDSRLGTGGYGSAGLHSSDSRASGHGSSTDVHSKLSVGYASSASNMSRTGPMNRMSTLHQLVGPECGGSFTGKHGGPDSLADSRGKSGEYRGSLHRSRSRTLLSPAASIPPTLQSVQNLTDLDNCLKPDLWMGEFVLKKCGFRFRCLHVIGDAELGSRLANLGSANDSPEKDAALVPVLQLVQRSMLDPAWMAEATHRIHTVLSSRARGLCLLLALPVSETDTSCSENDPDPVDTAESAEAKKNELYEKCYPLQALIAYLKLKQAVGLMVPLQREKDNTDQSDFNTSALETIPYRILLFSPSSFALSLLKQAAPNLGPEMATTDKYMVMLIVKR
ncbi:putative RNA-binding protein 15 [Fasciola hepatica]|uniref:RNA-binding protein 15 n=1 Tax=Fasciola hepatica TaxID=6192 RepID=A0A2H1CNK6_FASHE|nr:putative RNA-binding protein 15 [Fasciola hepatica]